MFGPLLQSPTPTAYDRKTFRCFSLRLKHALHYTHVRVESCMPFHLPREHRPCPENFCHPAGGLLFTLADVSILPVPGSSMKTAIKPLPPILTAHLFSKLDGLLLDLLRSLAPEDWEKRTVSPKWKVKDIAAHLLDTPLRGVAIGRDGYVAESPGINLPSDLAAYINRLNQEGVTVYGRLSPAVLIALMEVATILLAEYHASRDPYALAPYGVSWAGEEKSANWFDTAREFTERWHHQQQ